MKLTTILLFIAAYSLNAVAHVTMESNNKSAGEYAKLTFRVPHGCEGSATTRITVQIPEGILSVKPQVHAGWTITTKEIKLKKPGTLHGKPVAEATAEVTWSGGPLPDKFMDEFGIAIRLPDTASKLYFPVIQECVQGTAKWNETTDNGKFPAPILELTAKTKGSGNQHH